MKAKTTDLTEPLFKKIRLNDMKPAEYNPRVVVKKMSLSNLIGMKLHRLTVLSEEPTRNGRRYFKCQCDCGNIKITQGVHLNNGKCKSCGCFQKERMAEQGRLKRVHGFAGTRFYKIWKGIKNRCLNKNEPAYQHYGGRGINVSADWHLFENFKRDMYSSYILHVRRFGENDTSIDRIDNNLGYCKENCRWETILGQARNRRPKKLTMDDVRSIRQEYQLGNGKLLTQKYHVCAAVISEIVNYRRNYARL
jgi:hypothetical protein